MSALILKALAAFAAQLGSAILLAFFSESFLKKITIWALKRLAKSTKNDLDDAFVEEVIKKLDSKQE